MFAVETAAGRYTAGFCAAEVLFPLPVRPELVEGDVNQLCSGVFLNCLVSVSRVIVDGLAQSSAAHSPGAS
jgi:hypothetical protein